VLAYIRNIASAKRRDEEGASAVEYGLLVAAIAAIIILVVFALGGFVKGAFKKTCDNFSSSGQVTSTITTGTATCSG
jgi:pilus assembly protein Flp/PilA